MTRSREVSKGATRNEFVYTATSQQTTFSGNDDSSNSLAYTAGQIDVFVNGVRQAAADYTATNGTSVVLGAGASAGDTVNINAFGTFSVADVLVSRTEFDYTATAGQTSFTGSDNDSQTMAYTAGRIDVYLNGSRLNVTDDYTATNGTSVVLAAGAQAGDSLVVVAHGTVNLASNILSGDLDLAGNELILDADNDTTITADTDDQIDIKIAGADDFAFKANKFEVQTGSNIDMNGTELILDADGDTSITADTDDQIDIRISGADDFAFKANSFEVQTGSNIDMNGTELILDADADTSITADTDDQIDIKVGGSDLATLTDGQLTLTSATASRPGIVLESTNADANPPFLRFQKNGSSPADNDELAAIQFYADDDGGNVFVAGQIKVYSDDVTDGTEDSSITFTNINNGAANNCMQFNPTETVFNESSVDRDFRVETDSTANGFVVDGGQNGIGIGVSQKAYSDDSKVTMDFTGFTNGIFQNVNGTGSANFMEFNNGGGNRGEISTTGSNLVYSTSSDYRLKENVEDMTGAITRLKNLKPKRFSWVIDKKVSADTDGFLAHEVTDVVPDAVVHSKDETKVRKTTVKDADGNVLGNMSKDEWEAGKLSTTDENGKTIAPLYASDTTWVETETVRVYQSVDYSKLVTLLTGALQEAVARIETLETKVSTLEGG